MPASQQTSRIPPSGRTPGLAPTTVIAPLHGLAALRLRELWDYRELGGFLIWRDLKVRFRQTMFGVFWAVLQPLLLTAVFTIFLNRVAGVYSNDLPYAVFALSGVIPWTLYARALATSSGSLVDNQHLIGKVYFPRLLLPVAAASSYIVDFVVSLVVLAAVLAAYGIAPTSAMFLAPLFALWALAVALAFGTWLSAINVRYRDVQFVLPFVIQLWLLATPIAYPSSRVPARWQALIGLNPVAGVVEGFRWSVTGHFRPHLDTLLLSGLTSLVVLVVGVIYFRNTERTFADVI
jgi:lipopolysaccharide transport system permease protein